MNRVTCKFAKVHKGLPFFAEVELTVETKSDEFRVVCDCSGAGFQSQGHIEEASRAGYDDWKTGAKMGVEYAAKVARIDKCLVSIAAIRGLTTDTNPIIVWGTSAIAFWDAVGFEIGHDLKTEIETKIFGSWGNKE